MTDRLETIHNIRGFNRFYTEVLGLLDRHILNSGYSLTEARILFELNATGSCSAGALSGKLGIDKSYMSRIVARFEKDGLLEKKVSPDDCRVNVLHLTEKGGQVISKLIEKSDAQIGRLIAPLNEAECTDMTCAMATIKKHLRKAADHTNIRPFTKADIDFIITRQIRLYEIEYGFTSDVWKAYVTDGVQTLVKGFDSNRDCMYILESGGTPAGCIAITHISEGTAQLRFFFIEERMRGQGTGHRLVDMAIDFCKEKQYSKIILWTFSKLSAARHLYIDKGFILKETHDNSDWGAPVTEELWELFL